MRCRKTRSRTCIALVIAGALALASACHPPTPAASEPGEVVYIQPGHFVEEFADPDNILNQLILNAVNWRP